jgi:anti-sigma-K factor RskA
MTTDPTTHNTIRDDLAGYALGALDDEAAARVAAHLQTCASCRELLDEYEQVVRLLPLALPVTQPSPTTRAQLLARARRQRLDGAIWPHRTTLGPRARVAAALAAVLCLALVALAGWALVRDDEGSDTARAIEDMKQQEGVRIFPMAGSTAAPDAMGQLIVVPGERDAGLIVTGLPQLPAGRDYQFWFVMPDTRRISGAVFEVDPAGEAIVAVSAPSTFAADWRCGVTEEPDGGSPAPTGRNVLAAAYDEEYWDTDWD